VCACVYACRHEIYVNQYRAMFVLNCRVLKDEVLKYIPKPSKKPRKRHRAGATVTAAEQEEDTNSQEVDVYHPVRCSGCNTEVAVVDTEEVFHFFNVLPSAPT